MVTLTTTSFIKRGLDLSRYYDAEFGVPNTEDPTAVTLRLGGNRVALTGDYTINSAEDATGTVNGMDLQVLGNPVVRIRGVDLDAAGVIRDGLVFKLAGPAVVTVVLAHRPDPRTGRQRRREREE